MALPAYGEGLPGVVEYAQGPHQVVQVGPEPRGGDDLVGSQPGAVGQYHVRAVERLDGGDRLDPAGQDGVHEAVVEHRVDLFSDVAGVQTGAGPGQSP